MTPSPFVILFNGVPGSGKTTIAKEFARRSDRGACVDIDDLRNFVIGGKVSARDPEKNELEFEKQRLLAVDNAACLAKNYLNNGFNFFIADVVKIASVVKMYNEKFEDLPFYPVILKPNLYTNIKRDSEREEKAIHGEETITRIYNEMEEMDFEGWQEFDTGDKSVDGTVEFILSELNLKL